MTAVETVFELAKEAIEKREHHDEDCDREWAAIHQARDDIRGGNITNGVQPQSVRSIVRQDLTVTDSAVETVASDPASEHRVAVYGTNDAAYRHRLRWTLRGYEARTQRLGHGHYAVMVKGYPKS